MSHRFTRRTWLAAAALACALPAGAQEGTIKLIVGYPPGATSDSLTRIVAEHMQRTLKQTVVVDNKAGAGGRIANEAVKAAAPDGLTLLMTPVATMSIFPHSYAGQLRYDPFKDFVPVAHLSNFQVGLAVQSAAPVKTLADYVAWVRADPDKNGFYASAAAGSIPHFFGVMFARSAGITMTHVPYKGTAPAMQALAAGEVNAASTVVADIKPLVAAGKARLLAVAGEQRDPAFPEVPTFKQLGYDLVAQPWYALFAPAGTPAAAIDRLAKAAAAAVNDPAVHKRLVEMGLEPTGHGPAQLAAIMKADYERWGPPIRASGYKPAD
ncbi:tripartite tricarboxylate transporter substrate-binding protein [Ideonella alba]|uniref:ABC transporter substrate-binding protein n=1 Tax=Ideonella alba TaxID=2824118 RepID=A0A941BA97_9BURK|nr:tripartite tricarboxylate transporter substrate-binding protein [Ideonella alba]MBQ0929580.1 ABC transporter substrate-binding protein [Ideonella alba]